MRGTLQVFNVGSKAHEATLKSVLAECNVNYKVRKEKKFHPNFQKNACTVTLNKNRTGV